MDGKELKNYRNSVRMSQKELSITLDVSLRTVWGWENGEREVSPTACKVIQWMKNGLDPRDYEK